MSAFTSSGYQNRSRAQRRLLERSSALRCSNINRSVMVVTARQDLLDYCEDGGGEPAFRDLTLLGHLAIRTLTYFCLVHRCRR